MENLPALTPQQKYRLTDKCKLARERYYEKKGKTTAQSYYQRNRDVILERSKQRYNQLKTMLNQVAIDNNLSNDLTTIP
jgi:hypothetical protein